MKADFLSGLQSSSLRIGYASHSGMFTLTALCRRLGRSQRSRSVSGDPAPASDDGSSAMASAERDPQSVVTIWSSADRCSTVRPVAMKVRVTKAES
jgi:hypothetical protein